MISSFLAARVRKTVHNGLSALKGGKGCEQKMRVLREETVILDGVAEAKDLLGHLVTFAIPHHDRVRDAAVLLLVSQVELRRARIRILVRDTPQLVQRLHTLERFAVKIDHFRGDVESRRGVTLFRGQLEKTQDWNTADTPVRR